MELISGSQISQRRKLLGYSQVQLATKAGVSLPTLQNIEAGKANPSWDILQKLFNVLGYSIRIEENPPNWAVLAYVGVPIAVESSHVKVTSEVAQAELRVALAYLASSKAMNREEESLFAFAAALQDHYPRIFKKYSSSQFDQLLEKKLKQMDRGRFIRLRRAALGAIRKELFE